MAYFAVMNGIQFILDILGQNVGNNRCPCTGWATRITRFQVLRDLIDDNSQAKGNASHLCTGEW